MPEQKEGARPVQRSNAQPQRGAINNPDDTSIVRYTRSAVKALTVTASAVLGALLTATWALPAAWNERGYQGGIGGEWLLIIAAGWLGGWVCHAVAGKDKEEKQ